MKYLYNLIFIVSVSLLTACGGNQYSEEEQKILLDAEQSHFKAIDAFGDSFDQLNIITALEDSIQTKLSLFANQDSYPENSGNVLQELQSAQEQLTEAKNNLLSWSNDVYALPETSSAYEDNAMDDNSSIGKNEANNLIRSNIKFKEVPANTSPQEILSMQEEQLNRITTIQQQIKASIENANRILAENL